MSPRDTSPHVRIVGTGEVAGQDGWLSRGEKLELDLPGARVTFHFRDTANSGRPIAFCHLDVKLIRQGLMRFERETP